MRPYRLVCAILLIYSLPGVCLSSERADEIAEMRSEFRMEAADFAPEEITGAIIESREFPETADETDVPVSQETKVADEPKPAEETSAPTPVMKKSKPTAAKVVEEPVVEIREKTETLPATVTTNGKGRPDKVALIAGMGTEAPKPAHEDALTPKGIISTLLKLMAVLGLAYATILGLKWLSNRRDTVIQDTQDLKVKDTIRLSPGSSLHIVCVQGKNLLVGCTAGQVNLLQELEAEEEAQIAPQTEGGFAEYLEKYSESANHSPAGRVAGMLRDCTEYLRNRTVKRSGSGGEHGRTL